MKYLTLAFAIVLVLTACGDGPRAVWTPVPPPDVVTDRLGDWDYMMEYVGGMRDQAVSLVPRLEACDYGRTDAYPYVPCCYPHLPEAFTELAKSLDIFLETRRTEAEIYEEIYRHPMTPEQQSTESGMWLNAVHNYGVMIYGAERMLADLGCH